MSQTETQLVLGQSKVTDPSEIKRYDEEFKFNFYIPPVEKDTFDKNMLADGSLEKSAEKIGGQIEPIKVAVCEDDPDKTSVDSQFRIHGRIIDGRHRFLTVKANGKTWDHIYYKIKSFKEYMLLRASADIKKQDENRVERMNYIKQICEKYVADGMPKHLVCQQVVKDFGNNAPFSDSAVFAYVEPEYKSGDMRKLKSGKTMEVEETKVGKQVAEVLTPKIEKKVREEVQKEKDVVLETLAKRESQVDVLQKQVSEYKPLAEEYEEIKPIILQKQTVQVKGADIKVGIIFDVPTKQYVVEKV